MYSKKARVWAEHRIRYQFPNRLRDGSSTGCRCLWHERGRFTGDPGAEVPARRVWGPWLVQVCPFALWPEKSTKINWVLRTVFWFLFVCACFYLFASTQSVWWSNRSLRIVFFRASSCFNRSIYYPKYLSLHYNFDICILLCYIYHHTLTINFHCLICAELFHVPQFCSNRHINIVRRRKLWSVF